MSGLYICPEDLERLDNPPNLTNKYVDVIRTAYIGKKWFFVNGELEKIPVAYYRLPEDGDYTNAEDLGSRFYDNPLMETVEGSDTTDAYTYWSGNIAELPEDFCPCNCCCIDLPIDADITVEQPSYIGYCYSHPAQASRYSFTIANIPANGSPWNTTYAKKYYLSHTTGCGWGLIVGYNSYASGTNQCNMYLSGTGSATVYILIYDPGVAAYYECLMSDFNESGPTTFTKSSIVSFAGPTTITLYPDIP